MPILPIRLKLLSAALIVVGASSVACADDRPNDNRPNIVLIMADDHAANAISAYEGRLASVFKTPNIDRIAENGVRLNALFAANSIGTPSRASILTGQHSHVNGVRTQDDVLDRSRDNLAKQLQSVGYSTAVVGKWHLGSEPSGFDHYEVLKGQGSYYHPVTKRRGDSWEDENNPGTQHTGYATDVITDLALGWLDTQRASPQPFFLMLNHKAPHGPWEPARRHANAFDDIDIPAPDSLYERGNHGPDKSVVVDHKPGFQFGSSVSRRLEGTSLVTRSVAEDWPTGPLELDAFEMDAVSHASYQKYLKDYLRTLLAVDENVGRVLDYLEENGLAENTLVIYTSDQGMLLGEHDYYDKRWMYEESSRMPMLARLPGVIPAGTVSDNLHSNIDIAPTLLSLAGVAMPSSMQGLSFKNTLTNPTMPGGRDAVYYRYWMHMTHHMVPAHYGIRTKTHKLIFFYGLALDASGAMPAPTPPYLELYDLATDPLEMNNLSPSEDHTAIVETLWTQLITHKKDIGDLDEPYPELMRIRQSNSRISK